ncbi:helix-turn-helix domain-containing protein [Diplocloster modestus]|uniref:CdaR GGDEF-like domain-containing protein n=1 Tax=Diplocloster modestus TaxID=2850322 RepID=A0ABS6K3E0_9FIRM|nr:helix-turn-helix domain-containing protein [Diplocloster modestus]MBU9725024.1 hypothetical protein [Diplocloster modestus]
MESSDHTDIGRLTDLVKILINTQCSGLIMESGQTLHSYSADLADLCKAADFPLFTVPHGTPYQLLAAYFNRSALHIDDNNMNLDRLFQSLLEHPASVREQINLLNTNGFPIDASYRAVLIYPLIKPELLQNHLHLLSIRHCLFPYRDHYVLILSDVPRPTLHTILTSYYQSLENDGCPLPTIGIGESAPSLKKLHFSYTNALHARKVAQIRKSAYIYFQDLGFFRLLLTNPDEGLLTEIYQGTFKPLLTYDNNRQTNLMSTLKIYLEKENNLLETAQELHLTAENLGSRLAIIRDKLDTTLSAPEECFHLRMTFYIGELLGL